MYKGLLSEAYQKKLLKKWGAILESGKRIENEDTKVTLAQILENTRNFYMRNSGMLSEAAGLTQSSIMGSKGSGFGPDGVKGKGVMTGDYSVPYAGSEYGDFYLPNVVMPMLRRIMPDLIANELVGVQPLNGPVGYALAYRPTYGNGGGINGLTANGYGHNGENAYEIGYNPVDTRFTGVSAEMPAGLDDKYWKAYAGGDMWNGEGAPLGMASEYANINDGTYPTVSFQLVKTAVEAKTRKLAAHWSPELAEDMQAMHGLDVEKEMVNTLTYEVGAEIDRQIITEMVKAAIIGKSTSEWSPVSADGLDQMGRLATLLTQITIESNQIALRTKRGNANFVVTTPRVCALLQQLGMNKFTSFKSSASIPSVPDTGVGALAKIGMINDDQQLLVRDSHVQAENEDYVLMGYKGKNAGDSGIIYCPYIPLQLSKVMQPGTFTPSIGARTRYGVMSNPWDARNYYHFMKIGQMHTNTYKFDSDRQFIAKPSYIKLPEVGGGSPVMPM
jgi:hypothetical protein